jgi:hypothetical protein
MAELVKFFVISPLIFPVFLRRDNGLHALRGGLLKDRIGIIGFIAEKMIGVDTLNQF